jgi:phenylacetate-CoA ligase
VRKPLLRRRRARGEPPGRTLPLAGTPTVSFVDAHPFAFFSGYPSSLHVFASLIEENGLRLASPPSYVFLGAENTADYQRGAIERVTGARVSDQYGFAEGCGNASCCEQDRYHEDWEFGVLECGEPEAQPDGSTRGRILATGFANDACPFIRYDVGDTATWAPSARKCACGRDSTVIERIEGRNEDYIVTPEGARFMRLDHLWREMHGMREVQAVQREPGAVVIRYVPRQSFHPGDELVIRERARSWLSPTMRVEFEQVDEIPRASGGKFKQIVSELAQRVERA